MKNNPLIPRINAGCLGLPAFSFPHILIDVVFFSFAKREKLYLQIFLYNASARITKEYRTPAIERGYSRLILISLYSPLRCIENLL